MEVEERGISMCQSRDKGTTGQAKNLAKVELDLISNNFISNNYISNNFTSNNLQDDNV